MKLLFDENLSEVLARQLADVYPASAHLRDTGLKGADDRNIWSYAAENGFAVVTKDDDFHELSVLQGHPPKLVMIRLGNCPTREVEHLLRAHRADLEAFDRNPEVSVIELA